MRPLSWWGEDFSRAVRTCMPDKTHSSQACALATPEHPLPKPTLPLWSARSQCASTRGDQLQCASAPHLPCFESTLRLQGEGSSVRSCDLWQYYGLRPC